MVIFGESVNHSFIHLGEEAREARYSRKDSGGIGRLLDGGLGIGTMYRIGRAHGMV